MTLKNKILIIEQLNFFTIIFFCVLLKRRYRDTRYVHTSRLFDVLYGKLHIIRSWSDNHFSRLNFNDFPGSYCDIKKETGLYANDALFEKYHLNVYVHSALGFCADTRYSLAIKKELYNRYTQNRVKTFIFLKKIEGMYDQIIFLPVDREDFNVLLSKQSRLNRAPEIPYLYSLILAISNGIKILGSLVAFPLLLCMLAGSFLRKGVTFRPIIKKTYTYAMDCYSYGIDWNRPYHEFFIYNKSDFHPTKILHVFRSPLTDPLTENLFLRYHYPSAVWNRVKIPARFFRSRIMADMILKQAAQFCIDLVGNNKTPLLLMPCLATIKMTVESEIFYAHYQIKVFISRDEFSPLHIVRTLVAWKNKSHSIGFMHGDYTIPGTETSVYLLFDRYGIYGTFYRDFNHMGLVSAPPEIIGAGIYGLDKTYSLARKNYIPQAYREIKKTHKIILIVGTYSGNETDSCFTRSLLKRYYTEVLNATDEFSDYYRIIKPASDELSDDELNDIVKGHNNVIIDHKLWIYKLLLVSDLTLVIGSTTVGLESLITGKRVLYYDVYHYPENVYKPYSDLLVASDYPTFYRNIRSVIVEGRYLDKTILDLIRERHGYRFDGHVVERFRTMCRSLIPNCK